MLEVTSSNLPRENTMGSILWTWVFSIVPKLYQRYVVATGYTVVK